jgi:hypothetical protein
MCPMKTKKIEQNNLGDINHTGGGAFYIIILLLS